MDLCLPAHEKICRIAAEEFASLWMRRTGEMPKVTNADSGDLAVFGSDAVNSYTYEKIMDGTIQPFSIRSGSDDYQILSLEHAGRHLLFFAGGRPRALLYAVYRFFELRAECRYFWDGDRIPSGTVDISPLDLCESPRFHYRGLRYFAHRGLKRFQAEQWNFEDWKHEIDWILKKRLNLFMLRIGPDDLFQRAFPEQIGYPDSYRSPDDIPNSYNDRTLFWPLKYRGELRKKILNYAFERDLLHPEDCGTMSHWYFPTPAEFLDRVKPEFLPQHSSTHGERNLRVFDIRKDENLECYFRLTQAHVKHYGAPALFHTIGLAERSCFPDRKENFRFKLYAYRRIIARLRRDYPDAPLLISSWEFCDWTREEVRALVSRLSPENTLIFDYTADTAHEEKAFPNWNIVGRFPWIFGIFHAFVRDNDIRGNYDILASRLKTASLDTECKGLTFWPEVSHSDTLMLEFFAANAWDPENRKITEFLPEFCRSRYGDADQVFLELWRKILPIACRCGFQRDPFGYNALNLLGTNAYGDLFTMRTPENIETLERFAALTAQDIACFSSFFHALGTATAIADDAFRQRDLIDLGRTAASRLYLVTLTRMTLMRYAEKNEFRKLLPLGECILRRLGDVLGAHPDFSLWRSLKEMQKNPLCNPAFESTLKGNVNNDYCRNFHISELLSAVLLPEYRFFAKRACAGTRGKPSSFAAASEKIALSFAATPLKGLAPDCGQLWRTLPETFERLAENAAEVATFFKANQFS